MASDSNLITQELIVKLIKEEMKSHRLIFGLTELMVDADPYYCDLTRTIFTLIGFSQEAQDENLFNLYDGWMKSLFMLQTSQFNEQINDLALEFYQKLMELKLAYGRS